MASPQLSDGDVAAIAQKLRQVTGLLAWGLFSAVGGTLKVI
ncbi:MAG: hypothetical protein AAGF98_06520 [Cyanobacteria bacterium P01_H01_bin.153]